MERRLPEQERPPLWDEKSLHLSEEALEAYSLNRIGDEDFLASVEEHLLVCPHCQRQVEKLDSYHDAVREALPEVGIAPGTGKKSSNWQRYAIAAGLLVLLFIPAAVERLESPYEGDLVATRAEQGNPLPAGRKLNLQPDLRGLPQGELAWKLVSADGVVQGEGRVRAGNRIALPGLTAGNYWLRLSMPREAGMPLREFSLAVQ